MSRFDRGWVKIHRRAFLGDINSNFLRGGLFGALVSMANLQDSTVSWRGKPRTLVRGEIVTSFRELAELGGTDRKTISKHLNYLSLRGTISIEKSKSGVVIKLLNYHTYQSFDAEPSPQGPHAMGHGMVIPMDDGVPHIEEGKKKRKKEKGFSSSKNSDETGEPGDRNPSKVDWSMEAEWIFHACRKFTPSENTQVRAWLGEWRWAYLTELGGLKFVRELKQNAFEARRLAGLIQVTSDLLDQRANAKSDLNVGETKTNQMNKGA